MPDRIVYLMRGLPSCGKSHTARRLAKTGGLVLETDEYFYRHVGEDPLRYDYREELLPAARRWNFERFQAALAQAISPVIVDRGNGLNVETQEYAELAVASGYQVELKEPESEWWRAIVDLLGQRPASREVLYAWADRLSEMSRHTHRVPSSTIRHWMDAWRLGITVEDILCYQKRQPLSGPHR